MPIYSCQMAIAGLTLSLDCSDSLLCQQLANRYEAFSTQQPAALSVQIAWHDAPPGEILPPSYDFYFDNGRLVFALTDFSGEIDLASRSLRLDLRTSQPVQGVEYFLRAAYALWLFEVGGLLVHGAGLVQQELAYLFFGHSGSGKTTVSRLSTDAIVLNDDLVALFPTAQGWMAHATPFWNPTQVRPVFSSAPLAGLFRLVQDQQVWLEDVSQAVAAAELAASAPVVSADVSRGALLVMRCMQLIQQVEVKRLHFRKDATFWQVVLDRPLPSNLA
jgi:hypothetical protein